MNLYLEAFSIFFKIFEIYTFALILGKILLL